MRTLLVTGGCGFIGSHFVRLILKETNWQVRNLDLLTYAGSVRNLAGAQRNPRYTFFHGDIANSPLAEATLLGVDDVVHFAAETHVDRSIGSQFPFLQTNIIGTCTLLEALRKVSPQARFLHVSTDEVYGDTPYPGFPDERTELKPSSPYSGSKASSDLMVLAAHRTYGTDVVISRCTNNYGLYQYPEKLIPLFINRALKNEPLPLYDGGTQVRDWLRVEDHCRALLLLLSKGKSGEIYNIGANQNPEVSNREITEKILRATGKPTSLIQHIQGARPGHDQRYAVDTSKIRALGWAPQKNLDAGLKETINWYKENI